ncbi:MAG TPA: putative quinol monooxygenase [Bauldia sp.]|nr:putative quinol monooxygenase [Bauldia sp.]
MILVVGHLKFAPAQFAALKPAIRAMVEATRMEDGCHLYAFAEDAVEPGVLRIAERWSNWDALAAHGRTGHMAAWRAALKDAAPSERSVLAYAAGETRQL